MEPRFILPALSAPLCPRLICKLFPYHVLLDPSTGVLDLKLDSWSLHSSPSKLCCFLSLSQISEWSQLLKTKSSDSSLIPLCPSPPHHICRKMLTTCSLYEPKSAHFPLVLLQPPGQSNHRPHSDYYPSAPWIPHLPPHQPPNQSLNHFFLM